MESIPKFIELANGHVGQRGVVIPLLSLQSYIKPATFKHELYKSYFTFDNELVEHFKVFKTIKKFRGKYYLDNILFDIDKGVNTEKQLIENVRFFVEEELKNNWELPEEYIQVWFSGNGFHVVIPEIFGFEPSNELPAIVKGTLKHHFPIADAIYDGARLIRVGYSFNAKSGLFKTPISLRELFNNDIEKIKELASSVRTDYAHIPFESVEPYMQNMIVEPEKKDETNNRTKVKDDPSSIVTCVQRIYNEGAMQGSRHLKMLRMASSFRRHGVPMDGTIQMLVKWADTLEPYEVKRMVEDVYKHGYQYGCNDSIMKEYCDPKCIFYKRKDYTLEVFSAEEMEKKFLGFVRSDFSSTSFNLADMYNANDYWFYPGELAIVMGDTGLGKTAFVQNIVANLKNMSILFLSLEVHEILMFRRFIQIATGKSKDDVISHYKENTNTFSSTIKHIQIMSVAPEIKAINQLVAEMQPNIMIIDTTDMIEVEYVNGDIERTNKVINELKKIAQQQNIIIIAVHHINKESAKNGKIDIHSAKGSSNVYQKADKVIAIEGQRSMPKRTIYSLKSRDESSFELIFNFDPVNFRFNQLG